MISCKEASEFSIKKSEGALSLKERFQLWMHLAMCGICKAFAKQSDWIDKMSMKIDTKDKFSSEEKTSLKKTVFDGQNQ